MPKPTRLTTAAEIVSDEEIVIEKVLYPLAADTMHAIRLVHFTSSGTRATAVQASDLCGIVIRVSNIPRLIGKFESATEKVRLKVRGWHNHDIGQLANCLTAGGVRRFLATRHVQKYPHYRDWIIEHLLPAMMVHALGTD